jgi:hypothetical protein
MRRRALCSVARHRVTPALVDELAEARRPVRRLESGELEVGVVDRELREDRLRTRKKVRAVLMSFFKWAQAEFKLQGNPVVPIRSPRFRDVERELF